MSLVLRKAWPQPSIILHSMSPMHWGRGSAAWPSPLASVSRRPATLAARWHSQASRYGPLHSDSMLACDDHQRDEYVQFRRLITGQEPPDPAFFVMAGLQD